MIIGRSTVFCAYLALGGLLVGCGDDPGGDAAAPTNPLATTPFSANKGGAPATLSSSKPLSGADHPNSGGPDHPSPQRPQVITAEPTSLELGSFSTTETESGTITITNTSDQPVRILSAKGNCGCTTPEFRPNTVLGPGESSAVTIRLKGGPLPRKLDKQVTFNIEGYPPLRVPVRGESIQYIAMEPEQLSIDDMPDGRLVLRSIDDTPFTVTSALPEIITSLPSEAAVEHEIFLDWDQFIAEARSTKITFFFDHPKCDQVITSIRLNPEQRAIVNERIRGRPTKPGAADTFAQNGAPPDPGALTRASANADSVRNTPPPVSPGDLVRLGRTDDLLARIASGEVDIDWRDKSATTLLSLAAKRGDASMVAGLIAADADVEAVDRIGRTPLMSAGQSKNVEVIRVLLEAGADVNVQDRFVGGALAWTAGFGDDDSVQELVDAGAQIETVGAATGYTPLIWAAGFGDPGSVRILASNGADIDAADYVDSATPLIHASRTGQAASVKALLEAGAGLEVPDRNGRTAFFIASAHANGTVEKLLLLLEAGADPDVLDNTGQSPLEAARNRTDRLAGEVVDFLQSLVVPSSTSIE